MNNYIITTLQVDEDDYEEKVNSVYCTNCGSCGDFGCECWDRCTALYCKYGEGLIEDYKGLRQSVNTFYEMLVALGIDEPYDIDLDRVKKIANELSEVYLDGRIIDSIEYYFNQYKDEV